MFQDLNSRTIDSLNQLKEDLRVIEEKFIEILLMKDCYMDAFERNTLPIGILQERLNKVSNEMENLVQRKNK